AYFYWQTGRLIYLNTPDDVATSAARHAKLLKERVHPYLGFTRPYDRDYEGFYSNSMGFLQREPMTIPFLPRPNDVVVVVTGGSLAEGLVMAVRHGVPLRDALRAIPAMAGKNVVLISAAQPGAKQPQQFLALVYLLAMGQHVDLVINIDGF